MKIYLAGKIARNDWRHQLVPGLHDAYNTSNVDDYAHQPWKSTPMYRNDFHYVGPYFVANSHGVTHGENTHGAAEEWSGATDLHGGELSYLIAENCSQAIRSCDVLFAWLDSPCTAYGTLVEIGMASALGKQVVVASGVYNADVWFAHAVSDHTGFYGDDSDPVTVFTQWANLWYPIDEERDKCESPLEILFWDAHRARNIQELKHLVAQHEVTIDRERYRLDFAIPDKKIAFEMDGYTYHGKEREHFNRDRRRDLQLKLAGWEIHRFDGDMVRDNPHSVVGLACELVQMRAARA